MTRLWSFAAAPFVAALLCLAPLSPARAGILITVDKAVQQMAVEVDGDRRWTWPVSTGRGQFETPVGSFRPFRLEEDHYSKEWDEAPMPYSIFFTDGGHAIHGSNAIRSLGKRASHGCVRISTNNAAKLFELVKRKGLSNARVVVLNDPGTPLMVKRNAPSNAQAVRKPETAQVTAQSYLTPEQAFGYAPGVAIGVSPARRPALMPAWEFKSID